MFQMSHQPAGKTSTRRPSNKTPAGKERQRSSLKITTTTTTTINSNAKLKMNSASSAQLIATFSGLRASVINLALLTVMLASGLEALKVSVSIPELVKLNDAFWLNCSHNIVQQAGAQTGAAYNQLTELAATGNSGSAEFQPERVYSIKWYKDEEEFYRFLPSAEPKVSIYETNGISLDQSKSHEGNVYLTKAVVNTEGTYRCEVLSEAPLFETVRKSKHLRVCALPVKGPKIEILDANGSIKNPKAQEISYEVGDKIELRCNSAPSKPAARLKWYLNERELVHAAGAQQSINTTAEWPLSRTANSPADFLPASVLGGPAATSAYNVRITPVEYRQHYKGIYSSHSTLSLMLRRDNLVNGRISFKCLATMRQDVPIASKQLVVLTPRRLEDGAAPSALMAGRLQRAAESTPPLARFRAQYNTARPPAAAARGGAQPLASATPDLELINTLAQDERQQALMYIYEEADSTLGPSIIDGPETLERYLASQLNQTDWLGGNSLPSDHSVGSHKHLPASAADFNRADNLDYVQMMRERHSRQRSFPQASGTSSLLAGHRRLWGPNTIVRAPLYLDEFDSFRPVISWPPFDSGRLILLPPSHSIVAIPTPPLAANQRSPHQQETKFVLPPGQPNPAEQQQPDLAGASFGRHTNSRLLSNSQQQQQQQAMQVSQLLLERLIESLNCTSTESSIETRLSWLVNEAALNARDTRHYPTRISPDHKQTWHTIGLQQATPASSSAQSLAHILAQYYPKPVQSERPQAGALTRSQPAGGRFAAAPPPSPLLQPPSNAAAANEQLKLTCQAVHSMLLYSSSEMITFDFNPPPDERDKLAASSSSSSPSNVITAATASQTKSGSSPTFVVPNLISQGSHLALAPIALVAATLLSLLSSSRTSTLVCR